MCEHLCVGFIQLGVVFHARKEDVDLNNLAQVATGREQDIFEVLQSLDLKNTISHSDLWWICI